MKHRIISTIAAAVLTGVVLFPTPTSATQDDTVNSTDCDGTLGDDSAPNDCVIAVMPPAQSAPEPTDTPPPDGAPTINNPATIDTPATVETPVVASEGGTVPPATPTIAPAAASTTIEPVVAGQGGTVPPTALPETGSYSFEILQIGALLLLTGAAALFASRRLDLEPSA